MTDLPTPEQIRQLLYTGAPCPIVMQDGAPCGTGLVARQGGMCCPFCDAAFGFELTSEATPDEGGILRVKLVRTRLL